MTQPVDQQRTRFADLLEKNPEYAPIRHKQPPMWDLTRVDGGMPVQLRSVVAAAHIPSMNWGPKNPDEEVPEGTLLVDIDANGAFVAAASSAYFAHCALTQTGPLELTTGAIPGGYMLVDVHQWQLGAPGSPLGSARLRPNADGRIWVPNTVYALLRDLVHGASWTPGGHWPDATVYDSWTADTCRLDKWANAIRDKRNEAKMAGASKKDQETIKTLYSQAVQMWSTPPDPKGTPRENQKKRNKAYRPDWYATLRGQHFANMYRRAYTAAVVFNRPPLRVWDTDRMLYAEHELLELLAMPKSPIRLDETGLQLGTFKRVADTRRYAGIEV